MLDIIVIEMSKVNREKAYSICNHISDDKTGRSCSWSPIFFIKSMMTDQIGQLGGF